MEYTHSLIVYHTQEMQYVHSFNHIMLKLNSHFKDILGTNIR